MVQILSPLRKVYLEDTKSIDSSMIILSRDGKYVINTNGKKLLVWDADRGHLRIVSMNFRLPICFDIDATDNVLILFNNRDLYFYSLPDAEPIETE